jgi:DnaJ-class molecular chaperone
MIDKKLSKRNDLDDEMAKKIKDTIKLFTEIRIPLTKFQREGKNELYSGVTVPTYDSIKGAGWKIHFTNKDKVETKIIYRKNLADNLLELLKSINK